MFPTTFDLVRQLQVLVNDGGLLVRSTTYLSLGSGTSASACLVVDPPPAPVVPRHCHVRGRSRLEWACWLLNAVPDPGCPESHGERA